MKRIAFILLIGILFTSCYKNDDSLSSAERNTVSEDGSTSLKELIILINVKSTDSTYLVVKSIDSVNIYVNNMYWTKINSQAVDTTKIAKYTVGNQFQTPKKLNYLLIANQDKKALDYNTAGDFSRYLNSLYELNPGEYACLIESFQVTFNDNTTKKFYPMQYTPFKVDENSRSAFVGEMEVSID